MPGFIDAQGSTQQLSLDVTMYRLAADNGMTLEQWLNTQYPTDAEKHGSTFNQVLASEGIFVRPSREFGIRPSTMKDILDGRTRVEAGVVVKEAVPASRILFPAVIMSAIENKLVADLALNANALDQMIAVDDSINGDRYERPVLNFSKPEAGRSKPIAQLAEPASMLTITVSDVTKKIPTFGIGMEISDQAIQAASLDLVSLAVARQAAVERNERALGYLLALWNGDADNGQGSLSSISSKVVTAQSFDAAIVAAGSLTQKAWMKWLFRNSTRRTITNIVTDIDTALLIEGRTGKPTVQSDNPTSARIDTLQSVMNPAWPASVNVFINSDANWPANTIMGLDKRYAIHRVKSLTASYEAVEAYVLRRSKAMRMDFGEIVYRLFDDAYEGLTLTV